MTTKSERSNTYLAETRAIAVALHVMLHHPILSRVGADGFATVELNNKRIQELLVRRANVPSCQLNIEQRKLQVVTDNNSQSMDIQH